MLVLSVHLESGDGYYKDVRRQAQTRVLLNKVRDFTANQPMPVLYLGDFNSHEKTPARHRRSGDRTAARAHDRLRRGRPGHDQRLAQQRQQVPPHPAARTPRTSTTCGCTPGIGIRRFEIVANLKSGKFVGTIPSDHNPLAVDVVLPYPAR